jgi:hypothetical protein
VEQTEGASTTVAGPQQTTPAAEDLDEKLGNQEQPSLG